MGLIPQDLELRLLAAVAVALILVGRQVIPLVKRGVLAAAHLGNLLALLLLAVLVLQVKEMLAALVVHLPIMEQVAVVAQVQLVGQALQPIAVQVVRDQ